MSAQTYDTTDCKEAELDSPGLSPSSPPSRYELELFGRSSPGVKRIEALAKHITLKDRVFLFIAIFFLAYVYTLDNTLRYVYQPNATASYGTHSLLSTIATVRAVIAAAAQPTVAKLSDVFGRVELLLASVVFYMVGTIVEATSHNVQGFAAGAVLYQIGWTCVVLLVEVLIADMTSLRARLLFSYLPSVPYMINTWVSGDIAAVVLGNIGWSWGIGMFGFIYPVAVFPVFLCLFFVHRRARQSDELSIFRTPYQIHGARGLLAALFWQLDIIGNILLIAMLGCILVPFTLAGDGQSFAQAHILTPILVGVILIPALIYWEAKAPFPLVPFHLLRDRAVWAALGMACMLNFIWTLQGDYLYTVTIVAFNQSVLSATRIAGLYNFTSVLTGCVTGAVVFFVRRLKPFAIFGTTLFLVAFGLLIHYRGGTSQGNISGLIGAQVLLGIAGGLFPYTGQASIQAATVHEHVAVVTGLYLAMYNIGSALGNAVSGALWRHILPGALSTELDKVTRNATVAVAAFSDPFVFVTEYPHGTVEHEAGLIAYRQTQRWLCITGICLCVPLIGFSIALRNPRLTDTQSLPNAEKDSISGSENDSMSREG